MSANWVLFTTFVATLFTLWWVLRSPLARLVVDQPNHRSLHNNPIPRLGGVGIGVGVAISWTMLEPDIGHSVWIGALALVCVSLADDLIDLPVAARFCIHLATAGILAFQIIGDGHAWWMIAIAGLTIAWMTNLYNFMDGSDGLAGGMTMFGFGFYGLAAWIFGNTNFALLNFSIAAAAAAFLVFNFHPARIFMGDMGSVPLGFLAGAFGMIGWAEQIWPWWFPPLVFSPFIVDASVTLARRCIRAERVWQAHRDHYYQRLVQMGWGHRKTALAEYLLMTVCGSGALTALHFGGKTAMAIIVFFVVIYSVLLLLVSRSWNNFKNGR